MPETRGCRYRSGRVYDRQVAAPRTWNVACCRSTLPATATREVMMKVTYGIIGAAALSGALLLTVVLLRAQATAEVFTATAAVKTAAGAAASAPFTITIDRKMSQSEADARVTAFRTGGAAALRKGLVGVAPTGSVRIGSGAVTPTRFTLERVTGEGR